MAPDVAGERLLRCPVCGARTFYVQRGDELVFFALDQEGIPLPAAPHDPMPEWPGDAPVACAHCSWSGTIEELQAAQ